MTAIKDSLDQLMTVEGALARRKLVDVGDSLEV